MSSKKKRTPLKRKPAEAAVLRPKKNLLFLPAVLTLAIVPLVVHFFLVNVDPAEAALIGQSTYGDMYSQAKAGLLMIGAVIMLALGIIFRKKIFQKPDRMQAAYLAAGGVYLLFAFLSAVCSGNKSIAFWGVHDRAEGFVTIACYFVLFFYTIYTYRDELDLRHLTVALGIVTAVTAFLGVFQFRGHDLLLTDFGKSLIISPWDQDKVNGLNPQIGAGKLWGTLYHYDYIGSFAGIAVPFFLVLAFSARSMRSRVLLWIAEALSLWVLLGSTSRAGIIGVGMALLLCIILFGRVIVRRWKISLPCLALVVLAAAGANFATHGKIFERVPSLMSDIGSVFQSGSSVDHRSQLPVRNVASEGNTIVVTTQSGDILKASLAGNQLHLADGQGQKITVTQQNARSLITDPRFRRFGFSFVKMGENNSLGVVVLIDGQQQFFFRMDSPTKLQLTNPSGTFDVTSLASPPSFGFRGKEKLGSARGYIWSRANAMVPKNLILGSGPDTFVLNFPQNDLFGKYWAYGTTNMLVDKPHNLYLQTILGEGGIAFLAFLVILLLYVVDSLRLYALKKSYCRGQLFGAAVCLGIVGYLFAGFFNDSIVSVAPIFWIFLGTGIALNAKNRKKQAAERTAQQA